HRLGRLDRGAAQRVERAHTRFDQELQLVVERKPRYDVGVARVGTGEQRHPGTVRGQRQRTKARLELPLEGVRVWAGHLLPLPPEGWSRVLDSGQLCEPGGE